MKPINAYQKMKDFAQRTEVVKTTLRTTKGTQQLNSVKDFFVNLELLRLPEAMKSVAECFKKQSKKHPLRDAREMFTTWHLLLSERIPEIEETLLFSQPFKEMIDTQTLCDSELMSQETQKGLKKANTQMIQGVTLTIDSLSFLKIAVEIMELYVIPDMTEDELRPQIEDVNLN